jgi:hypothetical protein
MVASITRIYADFNLDLLSLLAALARLAKSGLFDIDSNTD